jgi:hypothetical protein
MGSPVVGHGHFGSFLRKNPCIKNQRFSSPVCLRHVQRVSFFCLRVGTFAEKAPVGPRDEAVVASQKDDGGSCSQVLPPASATLYAHTTAQLDPVRRGCRGGGFGVANLVLECTAHTAPSAGHLLPTVRRSPASPRLGVAELLRHASNSGCRRPHCSTREVHRPPGAEACRRS